MLLLIIFQYYNLLFNVMKLCVSNYYITKSLQGYSIYIYIFDNNFRNRYFITLEIALIHTVDIEDNKYYLNNIMEKVIPKSKTKLFTKTFSRRFDLKKPSSVVIYSSPVKSRRRVPTSFPQCLSHSL